MFCSILSGLAVLISPAPTLNQEPGINGPPPVLALRYDDASDPAPLRIHTQFATSDRVPGVSGSAWRTDGFSSWGSAPLDLRETGSLTVSTWVALASHPSDREVPVSDLSPSTIINQADRTSGFDVHIDTFGRWGVRVSTTAGPVEVSAPGQFPLGRWTHVAARIDGEARQVTLFADGLSIGSGAYPGEGSFRPANTDRLLARSYFEAEMLNFTINRLNGAIDETEVFSRALTDEQVQRLYARNAANAPSAEESLIVPASRFANDHLRPMINPMPAANWTNEPHGFVRVGETWHLFYQSTPNGPYKTQMHWGHMASDDLVTWRHLPDALAPGLQTDRFGFDMKGIWSGDVIVDGDSAPAFYTSVNHADRLAAFNPGISVAVSDDPDLRTWRKLGPILNTRHVRDFRDPYLWNEDGQWKMIIGAAYENGGGLDAYTWTRTDTGLVWIHEPAFTSVPYGAMDIGSDIWEMPVFEPLTDDVRVLVVNPIGGRVSKYGSRSTRAVYWTGQWRDNRFHPFSTVPQPLDLVPGHLAPTVARAADGRLRAIGIVDERRSPQAQEDAGWANAFSLPRQWFLMPDGRTLGQAPAPELSSLRGSVITLPAQRVTESGLSVVEGFHAYEIEVTVETLTPGARFGLDLLAGPGDEEVTRVYYDSAAGQVVVDKSRSTLSTEEEGPRILRGAYPVDRFGPVRTLRVFVDGSVIEVFINDAAAFSFRAYPTRRDSTGVRVFAEGAPLDVAGVSVWPLVAPALPQAEARLTSGQ